MIPRPSRRPSAATAFLPPGNTVVRHGQALGSGVSTEFSNVLRSRPRSILNKLAIGFVIGVAYLVFIWALDWDSNSELLPYFAIYALSGVIGGVVCTNALSWDAGRVRADLIGGRRLWHVLISKNWSMFVLVGTVGVVLSVLLAWPTGEFSTLVKALGELFTMMLIWLGIGNVLSVLSRRCGSNRSRIDCTTAPSSRSCCRSPSPMSSGSGST